MMRQSIEELIPHRGAMLLLDEITSFDADAGRMVATKTVGSEDPYLQGHFPGFPIVPGVITCECIFQTAAALLSAMSAEGKLAERLDDSVHRVPVVARVGRVKFKEMIRPGDLIEMKVELTDCMGGAYYLKGSAAVGGQTRASAEFTCMYAEARS
jgi:3-hydroxyacyl-[acyl-carrier-protein] dehydratase